jgi:nicotinate-nucleotide adenylyltransferase
MYKKQPRALSAKKPRIGIYAGAFDPVHAGHVTLALQALQTAKLDQVVFMPERRPRSKPGVEHYAHRVAMIKAALAPHPDLSVMEVVDRHFTVRRTLNTLQQVFGDVQVVLLMGSDTALDIPDWPNAGQLLRTCELVVGVRSQHQHDRIEHAIAGWEASPQSLVIFDSFAPRVSSAAIRQALRANEYAEGLLCSVRRYARREWLYVSPGIPVV